MLVEFKAQDRVFDAGMGVAEFLQRSGDVGGIVDGQDFGIPADLNDVGVKICASRHTEIILSDLEIK